MFRQLLTKLYCITSQKTNLYIHFVITPKSHIVALYIDHQYNHFTGLLCFHLHVEHCEGEEEMPALQEEFCFLYSNRYDLVHTTVFCIYWIVTKMGKLYKISMFCSVQYSENFATNMVDARMLDHLSKKELEKFLGVTRKFHQASVVHGIHLLRMMKYDRQVSARFCHCGRFP